MSVSTRLAVAVAAHSAAVVAANILTAHLGLVPVGFGMLVTAGTYAAGLALLARDFVHRYGGVRWSLVAVAIGCGLSWFLSTPALALASAVAFVAAELVDLLVYAPIRKHSFAAAGVVSNVVSAPVDTVLFLWLAGFGVTAQAVAGQFIGKAVWATLIPVALYLIGRRFAVPRQPLHRVGA